MRTKCVNYLKIKSIFIEHTVNGLCTNLLMDLVRKRQERVNTFGSLLSKESKVITNSQLKMLFC